MNIYTEEKISASNKIIWEILINSSNYYKWNSLIQSTSKDLKVGDKTWIFVKLPNGLPLVFKAYILEIIPNKRIKWESTLLSDFLLKGTHCFEIKEINNHECVFVNQEEFVGSLKSLSSILKKQMIQGFKLMNKELKKESEKINL